MHCNREQKVFAKPTAGGLKIPCELLFTGDTKYIEKAKHCLSLGETIYSPTLMPAHDIICLRTRTGTNIFLRLRTRTINVYNK